MLDWWVSVNFSGPFRIFFSLAWVFLLCKLVSLQEVVRLAPGELPPTSKGLAHNE